MSDSPADLSWIDQRVTNLFTLVSEAVAGATDALLSGEAQTGQAIVDADKTIDELTRTLDAVVWERIESSPTKRELRELVAILLILPELERSADLAEHIAQRAVKHLGSQMSPTSRGIVQRMSEVALTMWRAAADVYAERDATGTQLDAQDDEMDSLHLRLTEEVALDTMPAPVSAQVTLLARFYERIGDHAVNLARRIASLTDT